MPATETESEDPGTGSRFLESRPGEPLQSRAIPSRATTSGPLPFSSTAQSAKETKLYDLPLPGVHLGERRQSIVKGDESISRLLRAAPALRFQPDRSSGAVF